ncbi:hypothetical protein ABZ722_11815 [Streptomyces longwoodensis]|uniref:hypothetical protein n=1 Tax=Streptomyces longwoodensis TaxID=68231 RepID=UPI0033E4023F
MICDRCSQVIPPGRGYDEVAVETGSVAAATVVMCRGGCVSADRQRAPLRAVVLAEAPRYRPPRRRRR